jgi:very-short-patch-repair endonuclease
MLKSNAPQPVAKARARAFRKALTPPEARLWVALRKRSADGLRFRRQAPFGPYILDFYDAEHRVAVEVDGAAHHDPEQVAHDERRDAYL